MNITHKIKDLSTGLIHTSFQSNTLEGKEIALNRLTNFGVKNWIDDTTCKVSFFRWLPDGNKTLSYEKTFKFIK